MLNSMTASIAAVAEAVVAAVAMVVVRLVALKVVEVAGVAADGDAGVSEVEMSDAAGRPDYCVAVGWTSQVVQAATTAVMAVLEPVARPVALSLNIEDTSAVILTMT